MSEETPPLDPSLLPERGEFPPWADELESLTRDLMEEWGEGWGWTTGGCFAFAQVFVETFGGEPWGYCVRDEQEGDVDWPVHHAVVRVGDAFYDYTGRFDPKAYGASIGEERTCEMLPKGADGVFWFEDDFLDDDHYQRLRDALATVRRDMEAQLPAPAP